MIGRLRGIAERISDTACLIDVGGVGYLVHASVKVLAALPEPPEVSVLFIETLVREDAITLYGFASEAEQAVFRLLTEVQGVGARLALAILSTLSLPEILAALSKEDKTVFLKTSGVGPKLAARIITELKGKEKTISLPAEQGGFYKNTPVDESSALASFSEKTDRLEEDALSALAHLGYRRYEASFGVKKILALLGEDASLQDVIRLTLKELSSAKDRSL